MAIITLITDWHEGDHYLSALKGKLIGLMPELQIVDISHQLPSFAYIKAAFILRNSYRSFPKGTVHIGRGEQRSNCGKSTCCSFS